mmetsp:Transcript_5132/g.10223  ORF Transcript_5132/g.10223 Transcript_5132/m.10223 type:complete len:323 (+) Transcript_5132:88-1056(+)
MSLFAQRKLVIGKDKDFPRDLAPGLHTPLLVATEGSGGVDQVGCVTPPTGPDMSGGVSSFRITDNSSYSVQSANSRTSSTNSPNLSSGDASDGDKSTWEAQLVAAEMRCIEYMCREISIAHKRRMFLAMLTQADEVLQGSSAEAGAENYEDDGDEDGVGAPSDTRGRAKSSPETEMERRRSLDVLNNDIPKILKSMRENIVETELLIQELRYKLDIKEEDGVWGRQTLGSHGSPPGSTRPSSMGRRSTWHGSDGNSISTKESSITGGLGSIMTGRSSSRSGSEIDISEVEEKEDATGLTRRLSSVGTDMLQLSERMRAFTTT